MKEQWCQEGTALVSEECVKRLSGVTKWCQRQVNEGCQRDQVLSVE